MVDGIVHSEQRFGEEERGRRLTADMRIYSRPFPRELSSYEESVSPEHRPCSPNQSASRRHVSHEQLLVIPLMAMISLYITNT